MSYVAGLSGDDRSEQRSKCPKEQGQAMPLSEEEVIRREETATAKPKGRSELGKVKNGKSLAMGL